MTILSWNKTSLSNASIPLVCIVWFAMTLGCSKEEIGNNNMLPRSEQKLHTETNVVNVKLLPRGEFERPFALYLTVANDGSVYNRLGEVDLTSLYDSNEQVESGDSLSVVLIVSYPERTTLFTLQKTIDGVSKALVAIEGASNREIIISTPIPGDAKILINNNREP